MTKVIRCKLPLNSILGDSILLRSHDACAVDQSMDLPFGRLRQQRLEILSCIVDRHVVCSVKLHELGDGRRGDLFDSRDHGVDSLGGSAEEVDGLWVCIGESDCGCGTHAALTGTRDDILKHCKKREMIVSHGMAYKSSPCHCPLSASAHPGRWWFRRR